MRRGGFGCLTFNGGSEGADWTLSDELCGAGESPLLCTNDTVWSMGKPSRAILCRPSSTNGGAGAAEPPAAEGTVVLCSAALLASDKNESISDVDGPVAALLRRLVFVCFVFKGVADLTVSVAVGALACSSSLFCRLLEALLWNGEQ